MRSVVYLILWMVLVFISMLATYSSLSELNIPIWISALCGLILGSGLVALPLIILLTENIKVEKDLHDERL